VHSINSNRKNTLSWLWLLVLTVISTYVDQVIYFFNGQKSLFIIIVLFIVFLKGQQIIDIFMELDQAPKLWRRLLLGYVILLPIIIGFIYLV
jgi:cytochrome c oxidase subunit IV